MSAVMQAMLMTIESELMVQESATSRASLKHCRHAVAAKQDAHNPQNRISVEVQFNPHADHEHCEKGVRGPHHIRDA